MKLRSYKEDMCGNADLHSGVCASDEAECVQSQQPVQTDGAAVHILHRDRDRIIDAVAGQKTDPTAE